MDMKRCIAVLMALFTAVTVSMAAQRIELETDADDLRITLIEENDYSTVIRLEISAFTNEAIEIEEETYYKINCFEELSGRRLFLELKLLLKEQAPLQAIKRMNEFRLLQFISPEIGFTKDQSTLLQDIEGVISWFNLLYLEEPYEPWKVYWHGLTSPLDAKALHRLAEKMQMVDQESRKMIWDREEMGGVLEKLYRLKVDDNYEIYTLLSHYDTEILLFMMARLNIEKTKRMISNYFTKLKGTRVMLKGKDLKHMGVKPGPIYREIFDGLLKARLNNLISTKDEEAGFVKEMFGSHMGTA